MADEFDVGEGDQPNRQQSTRAPASRESGPFNPTPHNEDRVFGSHHENLVKAAASTEWQKWYFRAIALCLAVVVVLAAGFLEWLILFKLSNGQFKDNDAFLFLAISPIASITAITIFVLIGVFQGFRDKDMQRLPGSTAVRSFGGD